MAELGVYPTPVERLAALSSARCSLWIKRDDLTHPLYGGNKVRKLGRILEEAKSRGATRLVTVGALGSHHVLATAIFGRLAGMRVDAALLPQPHSEHVLATERAARAQGAGLHPVATYLQAARLLESWAAEGAYVIAAGGSSRIGTLGIVEAAHELSAQVRAGQLAEPDSIVVPLGSGGTVGGLVAGLAQSGLHSRVLAVTVTEPASVFEHKARAMAKSLLEPALHPRIADILRVERRYLGAGYGQATPESDRASSEAAQHGLTLDTTYTAKAFAAALDRVAEGRDQNVLFWHTLSSAPLLPLLAGMAL